MSWVRVRHKKYSKPACFEVICGDCGLLLIWSKLPDGVNRYLCPHCHRKLYVTDSNEECRGYSPTF